MVFTHLPKIGFPCLTLQIRRLIMYLEYLIFRITFGRYEDHKVNHNSFSRRKRAERKSWKGNDDEMFYAALRRVGTDFDMMAKILPGYTRYSLK